MSVRPRRLQAEYERITRLFANHERIRILEAVGDPPEKYVVEYHVKGLVVEGEEIKHRDVHQAEIVLGRNYPRELPRCTMLTPVFHPNIDYLTICTQDIGSAGETLDQLIVRIGEMIAYQAYNTKSPRNGDAALWTKEHLDQLPLEKIDLMPRELVGPITHETVHYKTGPTEGKANSEASATSQVSAWQAEQAPEHHVQQCANCGRRRTDARLEYCAHRHLVCEDCVLTCEQCRKIVCVLCDVGSCTHCRRLVCSGCFTICDGCQRLFCQIHIKECKACTRSRCATCGGLCTRCNRIYCQEHLDSNGRCPECVAFVSDLRSQAPGESEDPSVLPETLTPETAPIVSIGAKERDIETDTDYGQSPTVESKEERIEPVADRDQQREVERNGSDQNIVLQPKTMAVPTLERGDKWSLSSDQPSHNLTKRKELTPRISITHEDLRNVPAAALITPPRQVQVGPIEEPETSRKAIASVVFGIVGIPLIGILVGFFAIIFGGMALREVRRIDRLQGQNLAITGILLGVFDIILWIVVSVVLGSSTQ